MEADQATFGEVVRRLGAVHIVATSADDAVLQLHLHRKRIEMGGSFV
jgi:predicted Zn-dependent peptidase